MKSRLLALILIVSSAAVAQPVTERYAAYGDLILRRLSTAPFPHPGRANGHVYDGTMYGEAEHYRDSSVALFVPAGYGRSSTVDLVFYFHGWGNNIDTALARYAVIEQFSASRKNAVLVLPEAAYNAPDGFGGKLEDKDGMKRLIADVMRILKHERKVSPRASVGNIILAGHSGAYRVMSFMLLRGGLLKHMREVYLFDALYGQTEKFAHWIEHGKGRFINIYTDGGGTKNESENLMACLDAWKIRYFHADEAQAAPADLQRNRIVFLHSDLKHNEVFSKRWQFREYLATSSLKDIKKRAR